MSLLSAAKIVQYIYLDPDALRRLFNSLFREHVISRFLLASVAEQAGLSLACSHISEDRFSPDVAHMIQVYRNLSYFVLSQPLREIDCK